MADPNGSGPEESGSLGPTGVVQRLWAGQTGPGGRLLGALLTPAELGYRAVMRVRDMAYTAGVATTDVPPVPAISVGNITVGGTGKTPVVRWLVSLLTRRGWTPGILHGGYADDEPALHRRWFPDLPVIADRDRLRGAGRAMGLGADVLVLDDAFQHRRIGRDLDIVLVAAETWSRHARLLPRGPYREPPSALRRAHLVIVTRRTASADRATAAEADVARISGCETARILLEARRWLDAAGEPREGRPGRPGVAVAGIARPDDFFDQAEAAGARLEDAIAFPDHYAYTEEEAGAILRLAAGAPVVMTAKDAVKLAPMMELADLWILEQTVTFESGRDLVTRAVEEVVS
ncbi:MAG TPA: tetraacyldisaccharide 4'-kinase [Longimicrobiales bacterium]|nr:tetraacyldisaccharide 4'-kinase [Longimicrobiales bacterium]